ncbi:hypothetical protein AAC387_Pa07g2933 [Persea americana]
MGTESRAETLFQEVDLQVWLGYSKPFAALCARKEKRGKIAIEARGVKASFTYLVSNSPAEWDQNGDLNDSARRYSMIFSLERRDEDSNILRWDVASTFYSDIEDASS